jgi:hypothetical protein
MSNVGHLLNSLSGTGSLSDYSYKINKFLQPAGQKFSFSVFQRLQYRPTFYLSFSYISLYHPVNPIMESPEVGPGELGSPCDSERIYVVEVFDSWR